MASGKGSALGTRPAPGPALTLLGSLSQRCRAFCHSELLLPTAAVFENLDSSDVMETPAFPTVMKLLEVAWLLRLQAFIFVRRTQRLGLTEPQHLILITLPRLLLLLPTPLPGSQNEGKAVRANCKQSRKMMSGFPFSLVPAARQWPSLSRLSPLHPSPSSPHSPPNPMAVITLDLPYLDLPYLPSNVSALILIPRASP